MSREVIGWWLDDEGNSEEVLGEMPDVLDPWPFTKEARQLEKSEHERRLTEAVTRVEKLKARRREILKKLGRRG